MTILEIETIICTARNILPAYLHVKSRERFIKETRQIVMYFALEYRCGTQLSIESYYDLRHPMAWHSRNVINNLIDTDKRFAQQINDYRYMIDKSNGIIDVNTLDIEIKLSEERLVRLVKLRDEININVL
jgi:hypothetical protein